MHAVSQCRCGPARAAGPARPAAADPLRQARPAPVHQPPRLQPGLRAGDLPGPGADGVLLGLQPAPADLLRRRRADRLRQRGGVPRDRRSPRWSTPPTSTPRSTRRCPTGSTWSRSSSRPAGRSPTCSRPATGGSTCPAPRGREAAVAAFLATDEVTVERMTKKGLRDFDCPGAGRLPERGRARAADGAPRPGAATRRPGRAARRRAVRAGRGRPGSSPAASAAHPARQGPLDQETGDDRRPAPSRLTPDRGRAGSRSVGVVCDTRRGRPDHHGRMTRRRSRSGNSRVVASPRRGPAGR